MAKDEKRSKIQDKLTDAEKRELEAILDRLSVQNPDGDSFSNWLESLKNTFSSRQRFITALLDVISKSPTEAGKKVFLALKDCVRDKELRKIVRTAEYRMTQKGFITKEQDSPKPEKVVVFSDKPLKNIEVESGEAHLWIFPFCGRCSVTLYVPSLTDEGRSVVVGSDVREWGSFFVGESLEPDKILQVMVEYGSKRVYKELTSIIAPMPSVTSVSVSIRFGALLASELIDIFSKYRPMALKSKDLQVAKDLFNSLLTDDVKNLWTRELGFSEPLTDHVSGTSLASLAQSLGSFWFEPKTMMEVSDSLLNIVDSVLSWDQAHKEYHLKRKFLDFICSGDRFSLELYSFFLKNYAVVMAKRDHRVYEAQKLLNIAQCLLESKSLNNWEDFFIVHLCRSFADFAEFNKYWDEKRRAQSQPVVSSLVVVPGEEGIRKSKWALLEEFLTTMISSARG